MDLRFLIPVGLMVASVGALVGVIALAKSRSRRPDKRSPLTEGLLRPPGQALRDQLEDVQWDVAGYMATAMAIPMLMYALYLQHLQSGRPVTPLTLAIYSLFALGAFGFVAWKTTASVNSVRSKRLGLEAEMAAAEEINQLMRRGFATFHDVPAGPGFNIDHVIVGPTGVFAVETKGRPKQARGSGKAGSTVRYDGKALQFPDRRETKPVDQANRTAEWLHKWLTKAVGEPVPVRAVLLLPGWWVERVGRGDVLVGNAKEIGQVVAPDRNIPPISSSLQTRIDHQLDQRCRNIEPRAYADH
jgi:hypothetical protein